MQQPTISPIRLKHVSYYTHEPITSFVPRIPKNRASSENDTIPRICVSTSLSGCLVAHPSVVYRFVDLAEEDPYELMGQLHVLPEHGISGMLFRVYHFEVSEKDVFTPEHLKERGYVGDALLTREHWIMQESEPVAVFYLLLQKFESSDSKRVDEWGIQYTEFTSLEEMGTIIEYLDLFDLAREKGVADDEWFGKSFSKEESVELSILSNQMRERQQAENRIYNASVPALPDFIHSTIDDDDFPF